MINEQDKQRIEKDAEIYSMLVLTSPSQKERLAFAYKAGATAEHELLTPQLEYANSTIKKLSAELERSEKLLQEYRNDAITLATLLDEIIGYIPFDAWPQLHEDLAKQGHTKDYLKALRDKYADRYRNV